MLIQLVGDAHHPLHAAVLVSDRYPKGDRGGVDIPLSSGESLYALWDHLLGKADGPDEVARVVEHLRADAALWNVALDTKAETWIAESRKLAESSVYSHEVRQAVEAPGDMEPIHLSDQYVAKAKQVVRQRVVAAGVRLASKLHSLKMSSASRP